MFVSKLKPKDIPGYVRQLNRVISQDNAAVTLLPESIRFVRGRIGQLYFTTGPNTFYTVFVNADILKSAARIRAVLNSYIPVGGRYYPMMHTGTNEVRSSSVSTGCVEHLSMYWALPDKLRWVYIFTRFYGLQVGEFTSSLTTTVNISMAVEAWKSKSFNSLLELWFELDDESIAEYKLALNIAAKHVSGNKVISRAKWLDIYRSIYPNTKLIEMESDLSRMLHFPKTLTFDKKEFNR